MTGLRIALAQINATVGDLAGNRDRILARIAEARDAGAQLVAFPEMAVTGYPPEDLLLKTDFIAAAHRSLEAIAPASRGLTVVLGTPFDDDELRNAAAILHDGEVRCLYAKHLLPNYGVFDEHRYFRPGRGVQVFEREGVRFGVTICEDIWYPDGPQAQFVRAAPHLILNISASPYHMGKGGERERMLATRASDASAYVAYCNLVGGQDELVFDGQSVVFGPRGELLARGRQFADDLVLAEVDVDEVRRVRALDGRVRRRPQDGGQQVERVALRAVAAPSPSPAFAGTVRQRLEPAEEVYQALVLGTRDYVHKSGFEHVVIGLSGGIDSALTAVIAADALGPEHVVGVAMPTRYSSSHSLEDACAVAKNLGIRFLTIPIDDVFQAFLDALAPGFADRPQDLTEENIQPRVRGTILMALSNKLGWLVLTTGNKSEVGVGYSTLYGDTAGGYAVIKDVPKTLVYELVRFRNARAGGEIVPQRVFDRPPSAELRPDQKDSDSLPEYAVLDPILDGYVREGLSAADLIRRGHEEHTVRRVIRMIDRSEYKRRQAPPGVRVTGRAFGKDWRLPIANRYIGP